MITTFIVLLSFTLSFVLGGLLIFNLIVMARKKRIFGENGERHSHNGLVPRIAGLAFFPTVFFTVTAIVLFSRYLPMVGMDDLSSNFWTNLLSFLLGFGILYTIGLQDDLFGLGYRKKFFGQVIVAIILVSNGLYVNNLCGLAGCYMIPNWLGMIITCIIIIAVINAFNLFDGIDGLCAGLTFGIVVMLQIWFIYQQATMYAIITAAVLGVITAYLFFNFSKGRYKIFMGDTGSMSFGYIVIYMLLIIYSHNQRYYVSSGETEITALGFIFFPLFDMSRVFFVRIMKRKSPFLPDNNHLHHKVLAVNGSHTRTTLIILALAAGLALMNFLMRSMNLHIVLLLDFGYALGINYIFNKLPKKS